LSNLNDTTELVQRIVAHGSALSQAFKTLEAELPGYESVAGAVTDIANDATANVEGVSAHGNMHPLLSEADDRGLDIIGAGNRLAGSYNRLETSVADAMSYLIGLKEVVIDIVALAKTIEKEAGTIPSHKQQFNAAIDEYMQQTGRKQ
jgi:hypothetical protein